MAKDIKEVKVYSVVLIPQLGQYLVTLEETDGIRLMPIWVGPAEGMSIAASMGGQKFPRPMTHDLMSDILQRLNTEVKKVTITDIKDGTFYAAISLSVNGKTMDIDSRPSDAIALAVRSNSPIFMNEVVFEKCPVIQKPITKTEIMDFKKRLKDLKPEDFFKGT